MQGKLELHAPIEIDGNEVSELTYDPSQITITQFAAAEAAAKKKAANLVAIAEFDYTFHFYLGAYSIIAANPSIDVTDLERIKGLDIMQLIEVGRFFTMRSDEQEDGKSDEQPATTPESSQLPFTTSTACASSTSSPTTARP